MFYYVQRVDESWHVAEVIQKRENLETKEQEFYVHYKECEYISMVQHVNYMESLCVLFLCCMQLIVAWMNGCRCPVSM